MISVLSHGGARVVGVAVSCDGLAKWAIDDLLPEFKERLAIPADHRIGFMMVFGPPAVEYHRTVDHGPAVINHAVLE